MQKAALVLTLIYSFMKTIAFASYSLFKLEVTSGEKVLSELFGKLKFKNSM